MPTTSASSERAPHFDAPETQAGAARHGMWVFLASELMLFAGLFGLYGFYRAAHAAAFEAAGRHAGLALGTINTVALITSSLTVALSVDAVRRERPRLAALLLGASALIGAGFLALKGVEWAGHAREGILPGTAYRFAGAPGDGARLFFTLYYVMTGLHAVHVLAGVCILGWLAARALEGAYGPAPHEHVPLELGGLYWHLVDIVWIFIWPMFYPLR